MKFDSSTRPPTSTSLPEDQVPVDSSDGFYVAVVLDHNRIYKAHLPSSTKGAADEFSAQFAYQNKSEGVPPSQWSPRVRRELIKLFVKAHRRRDHATRAMLAHIVAAMIGSQFFIVGVTRKGAIEWVKTCPAESAAGLEARVEALLNRRSQIDAHTAGAHATMGSAIHSRHFHATQAQVRQAESQLQALREIVREFRSGKAFDEVIVSQHD